MAASREPLSSSVCPTTSRSGCLLLALLAPPPLWRVLTTSRLVKEVTLTTAVGLTSAMLSALPASAALEPYVKFQNHCLGNVLTRCQGYCGNTAEHCNAPDCLFNFGPGCDANKTPAGASTRNDARPQKGSVAYGAEIYACRKPGTVAITYDDGPYIYTDEVLNKFAAAGFKATFFVTGINIGKGAIDEAWAPVIRRMVAEGHQVASHTWSHQDLSRITEAQVYDQMVKNEMAIRNIIGKYPTYMRPPYSSCDATCLSVLKKLGYVVSLFDLDTDDYNQLTPVKIETAKNNFRTAVNGANPSSQSKLAIAHDIHELTALNLTVTMIETLQARGFKGVTMGECMNEPEANWYRDSTPATPGSSTTRTSAGPTSTPTGTVSTDGTCGAQGKNQICIGSEFGNCCSQYGYCGKSVRDAST
jgi:peptidoglycan/xylan/chitin deacetylase (PgdA/CDA1 family)